MWVELNNGEEEGLVNLDYVTRIFIHEEEGAFSIKFTQSDYGYYTKNYKNKQEARDAFKEIKNLLSQDQTDCWPCGYPTC